MRNVREEISFSKKSVDLFLNYSGDHNPLHCDEKYARRTPFGQIVVPGIAIVLTALGKYYESKRSEIKSIEAEFKQPLFLEKKYFLEILDHKKTIEATVKLGETVFCKIQWTESFVGKKSEQVVETSDQFVEVGSYEPHVQFLTELKKAYLIENIDEVCIHALAWASFFIGMIRPGKQALFAGLKIIFKPAYTHSILSNFELFASLDDRFGHEKIWGHSEAFDYVELSAFHRPPPIEIPINSLSTRLREVSLWKSNPHVVVIGGSRGLGATFSQSLAELGASVVATYHHSLEEALKLEKEAEFKGNHLMALKWDPTQQNNDEVSEAIKKRLGKIDAIFITASTPIWPNSFLQQSSDEFYRFLHTNLQILTESLRALHPLRQQNCLIVFASSQYVQEAKSGYTHYIAVKSAADGILRGLANEWSDCKFATLFIPRILTDQTNVSFSLEESRDPVEIVKETLSKLKQLAWKNNYEEINFEDTP